MNNNLICLEGRVHFDEEVRIQSINVVTFKTGQQITINRDRLPAGTTLFEHVSQQIKNAEKIFNQFNLIKIEKANEDSDFFETVQVIYSFASAPGAAKRHWQVTYSCLFSKDEIINFTSLYPDEATMKNEIVRLQKCLKGFAVNKDQ